MLKLFIYSKESKMREQDFLERLTIARDVWVAEGHDTSDVDAFISWVYQNYGMIEPPKAT